MIVFLYLPSMSEKIPAFRMDCSGFATDQKITNHKQERTGEQEAVTCHLLLNRIASSCPNIFNAPQEKAIYPCF